MTLLCSYSIKLQSMYSTCEQVVIFWHVHQLYIWANTYRDINSDLSVHPMYQPNHYICELHRIATTRPRFSSHRLRIETGRWSRIPREERLCSCGENNQTESHVLLQCPQTALLRLEHNNYYFIILSLHSSLFTTNFDTQGIQNRRYNNYWAIPACP